VTVTLQRGSRKTVPSLLVNNRRKLMATILIESDDGKLPSASAVLQVRATNAEYNQPALRIDQASDSGGAASIKIFDPNPDIEFVELGAADAAHPARGKYEIAVQSDELQINGRKEDNSGFESIMVFQRLGAGGAGGNVGFRTGDQFGGAGVSSRSRMPSPPHRSILVAAVSSMSRVGRSSTAAPRAR
jgi:hypothetical protein